MHRFNAAYNGFFLPRLTQDFRRWHSHTNCINSELWSDRIQPEIVTSEHHPQWQRMARLFVGDHLLASLSWQMNIITNRRKNLLASYDHGMMGTFPESMQVMQNDSKRKERNALRVLKLSNFLPSR